MKFYFSYSLTSTRTLSFGYIKWTHNVALTGSFLGILFGQYVRRGMGRNPPPKMRNEFVVANFHSAIFPMVSCLFLEGREAGV